MAVNYCIKEMYCFYMIFVVQKNKLSHMPKILESQHFIVRNDSKDNALEL